MANHQENAIAFSYLTLRKAVGWIGVTLRVILVIGGFVFQKLGHESHLHIESSISAYYYTGMRNVLVGLLCAIGVFHLATEGFDLSDRIAGRLACIFAFGVAWVPNTPELKWPAVPTHAQQTIGEVHYIFGALLFLTLAFFCIHQFTQTADLSTRTCRKKERNDVYYGCGGTILGCISVSLAVKIIGCFPSMVGICNRLGSWKWNFWIESIALFAFGAAFLTKGEFILKDEDETGNAL